MESNILDGIEKCVNPTPQQIEALEIKYGKLKKATVKYKDGSSDLVHTYYFKTPRLMELRLANKKLVETRDTISYAEIIIKSCVVNGKQCIIDNEDDLIALVPLADELASVKVAEIEKN